MKIALMLSLLAMLATANARETITTGRYIYSDDFLGTRVSLIIDLDRETIENPQKNSQPALPFARKTTDSERYVIDLGAGVREFQVFKSDSAVFLCAADEPSKCRILKPAPPQ
jgi:hypothetical protein